jgi:hypothetical protein
MIRCLLAFALFLPFVASLRAGTPVTDVVVDPAQVRLSGPNSVYTLLVHGKTADGRLVDLTSDARFQAQQPAIATVTSAGVVHGKRDGVACTPTTAGSRSR